MKLFLSKIFLFFCLVFLVDTLCGAVFSSINKVNESEKSDNYIMMKVNQDILIFGSSRANRHYDTRVLSDSLQMSCFNCGQSGQGFIHNYILLDAIMSRYIPKLIIYDVYPPMDFYEGDNIRYIKSFRPYRENKEINNILQQIDMSEKYKVFSKMYCFNDICNNILFDYLAFIPKEKSINGFIPTRQEMNFALLKRNYDKSYVTDSIKLLYAKKFIELSKKTKVVLVMSPTWYGYNEHYEEQSKMLAKALDVPFIDFTANTKYKYNSQFFFDGVHLNEKGAESFSKDLIRKIKDDFSSKRSDLTN